MQLGHPENVKFIGVGGALMGSGFNEIIFDSIYDDVGESLTYHDRCTDWVESSVVCRLLPNGVIKYLEVAS